MRNGTDVRIPAIKIYVCETFQNDEIMNFVLNGIEEESVPCEIVYSPNDDAVSLGFEGANASNVDVGIGIDSKGLIAVHYKKLAFDKPMFTVNYNLEQDKVRNVCSNAARLIKRIPFILD